EAGGSAHGRRHGRGKTEVRLRRAHFLLHWASEQSQCVAGKQRQENLPVQLSLETVEEYSAGSFLHRRDPADRRRSLSGSTNLRDRLAEALGSKHGDLGIPVQTVWLLSVGGRRVA